MTALLLKFAPWIGGVLVLLGLGGWCGYKLAQPAYNRLQGQYEAFQLTVANQQAAQQKAATDALEAQIAQRNQTEARNAQLEQSLSSIQDQATTAQRSADFANRLLAAARKAAPASGPSVPEAPGHSPVADPASSSADGSTPDLAGLIAGAATECRDAIQDYAALQLELAPQL